MLLQSPEIGEAITLSLRSHTSKRQWWWELVFCYFVLCLFFTVVEQLMLSRMTAACYTFRGPSQHSQQRTPTTSANFYVWTRLASRLQLSINNNFMSSVKLLPGIELCAVKFQSLLFIPAHIIRKQIWYDERNKAQWKLGDFRWMKLYTNSPARFTVIGNI